MLTGVRAFQAEEPAGVVNQILNTDPPPIAGVPANVSEAVERCLRKDPEERYQSTREIIASLKAGATDAAPSAITAVPTPRPEAARGGRGLPRVFRLWPVLAAVAAVLAVGALLLFRPWTRLGGEPTTIDVAGEAPSTTAEGVPARPEPPPPLDTPEAEEADVRRRATFHYPEDFEGGLEWFDVGPTGSGVTTVEDDALVLAADPSPVPGAAYPHWSDFRGAVMPCEFVIEARMTKLEGPDDAQFGFAFHAALVDAYVFALCGNGDVWIVKEVGGRFTELARVERAPQVNRGNAENVLKAVRRHGQLHIFINDQHVLTAEDFDLGTMMLCLVVTSGVRAAFSDILVQGISMRGIFYDIDRHMARLETREAREKLDYLRLYAPNLAAPGIERALESIDRRTTVMVIIPPGARLRRGGDAPAKRLVDTINAKGEDRPSHFALDVTETEVESKEAYLECPLIAIGHPDWTAMTERLRTELPRDREVSTDEILIYHDIGIPGGEGRVALWGQNTKTDMDAVELFIDKLLDEYLKMIWEEQ
jgi:hypothetical protein